MLQVLLLLISASYSSFIENKDGHTRNIYVLTDEKLFDKDELKLILKFSTEQRPFIEIQVSNLSQHSQSTPLFNSIYIAPPFNLQAFYNESSTFASIGKIINEMYHELDASKQAIQNTRYAELGSVYITIN